MQRQKQPRRKGHSTRQKSKSQKKSATLKPSNIVKKKPTSTLKPKSKSKPIKRKKLKSLSIGKKRIFDDSKISVRKSTTLKPSNIVKKKPTSTLKPKSKSKPTSSLKHKSKSKPTSSLKPKSKSKPTSTLKPKSKSKSKPIKRKKLKSLSIGKKRIFDDSKISVRKSTQEKAAILRKIKDLPFNATKKFTKYQKYYIDKHYDGLDGEIAFRRLIHLKKVKIDEKDSKTYADEGYIVVTKTYKRKGRKKKGTYILIYSPHIQAGTHSIKNGFVTKYLDRVEITILITTPEVFFMLENPEYFIQSLIDENWLVFKKYKHLKPEYKLIYPLGESKYEYDDLENLHHYMQELEDRGEEEILRRISGITFIYHL